MAGLKRTSVVIAVEGIKQGAVLTDKSSLGGGGTCIDTKDSSCLRTGKDRLSLPGMHSDAH